MKALPPDVFPYKRTPEFTQSTVPPGLLPAGVRFCVEFHRARVA